MEREPIKNSDLAEVWPAAKRRRASDLDELRLNYFRKRSVSEGGAGDMIAAGRHGLTVVTGLVSLLADVLTTRTHQRYR